MGGSESTPEPSPRPTPRQPEPFKDEFEKPWRNMLWGTNINLEQELRDFKTKSSAQFVRILLAGGVGAGKSSFINSVNNVFQKRITCEAQVDSTSGTSFTKKYRTHYIKGEDGSPLPFVFNDIMGLEDSHDGANTQDIIRALHGILQEGFNFEVRSSGGTKELGYRSTPSIEHQTFCLVNVISADKISLMTGDDTENKNSLKTEDNPAADKKSQKTNDVIEKLKKIRQAATELNIPQVIILTRPDLACPLVKSDIRKIYTSKKIKEKMQKCSNVLGISMNYIFPVKNYHEEIDTDEDIDLLILKALDQIVKNAADALDRTSTNPSVKQE